MTKDMTKGPVFSTLVGFTIPLILGNLLQLTYNAADSMILGRYVGKEALAAAGTSNPLMTLLLLFTNGICLGAGILVSFHYGAKEIETLKRQVSTGMLSGIVFSLAAGILAAAAARPILGLLKADPAIIDMGTQYLRIIMMGLAASFVYNYLASMLRAMGDSRSPLYFLGISAGLNIVGDLLLVVVLKMGIIGAAISTVVCEGLSALLCWIYIYRRIPELRLGRKWLVFDRKLLRTTLSYGIVSALQQSTVQMGKLAVQAFVNTLGVSPAAAFNATNRADDYAMVPEQNLAHGMSSVMAQNVGAGKPDRVRKIFRDGLILELSFGILVGIFFFLFAEPLMRLFTSDPEVITEGIHYLRLIAFMYPLPALTNGIQGYFRGIGDLKVTLYSSMVNMGVRVLFCYFLIFRRGFGFEAIPWSYAVGWAAMLLIEAPYLIYTLRKN
ncbi:MAG: MATE family efflux transporter [Blautia sp.]|nr:MATE family efflux transporter [Blautia sp.]